MQSVLHLEDSTVADLVDEASADRVIADAFAAWGRGEAATTQRVRAAGRDAGLVSAMAAVVPPYCGGKLYATNAGRFTFVNVLFDVDGTLLATVDGDVVTARRTAAGSALRSATWPRRTPRWRP
jgi:ornithine cyclodeaminase